MPRKSFIDDGNQRASLVACIKKAALQEAHAHRLTEAGAYQNQANVIVLPRHRGAAFGLDGCIKAAACVDTRPGIASRDDTRMGLQPPLNPLVGVANPFDACS